MSGKLAKCGGVHLSCHARSEHTENTCLHFIVLDSIKSVRLFDTILAWCFPIRSCRDERFYKCLWVFAIYSLAYYSNLPEFEFVLMGNYPGMPDKSCAYAFCPKTVELHPSGWKIWAAVVSLYILFGIRKAFMIWSQWIRGNQVVLAIYGWLFIVHFQLIWTKFTCCWIKCRFSKLPEVFCCTVTWKCRCAKSSWKNED